MYRHLKTEKVICRFRSAGPVGMSQGQPPVVAHQKGGHRGPPLPPSALVRRHPLAFKAKFLPNFGSVRRTRKKGGSAAPFSDTGCRASGRPARSGESGPFHLGKRKLPARCELTTRSCNNLQKFRARAEGQGFAVHIFQRH